MPSQLGLPTSVEDGLLMGSREAELVGRGACRPGLIKRRLLFSSAKAALKRADLASEG